MNKYLYLAILPIFLFIIGSNQSANAQAAPSYQWGESVTLGTNDDIHLPLPIRLDEKGNYVAIQELRTNNQVDHWYVFNSDFKKTRSAKMAFNRGSDGSSRWIHGYVALKEKVYMLYESWTKNAFEHKLQIVELKSNGEPTVRKQTLASIYASKDNNIGTFLTQLSEDKSKLLVFSEKPYDKKLPELAKIQVFETSNWEEIQTKDVTFANKSHKKPNHKVAVANNGDVCFFKELNTKKEKGLSFWSLPLEDRLTGHQLQIGKKSIMGIKPLFSRTGEPVAIGVYEEEKTLDNFVYGQIFVRLSKDGTGILNQELLEMQGSNKENFNIDLVYEYKDNIENGVQLIDVYQKSDGDYLVLSELFKSTQETLESKNGYIENNTFEYGNAFVFHLNEEGLLQSIKKLSKYQKESGQIQQSKFSSVLPYFKDDNLYLFYNNTELVLPYSNWTEPGGEGKLYKKDIFGSATFNPTFMEVILANGRKKYANRTYGLPLGKMHESSDLMVSLRTDRAFPTKDGLVVLAQDSANSNVFRIGKIILDSAKP